MANILSVPNFIKARSPIGLRRLMYELQLKRRHQFKFSNISFVNGEWYAWYEPEPKTDTDKLAEAKELTKKGDL